MTDLTDAMRRLRDLDEATGELRVLRDELGTLLYALEMEKPWVVPKEHRPTCPLTQKQCTSWTCLLDVCVDAKAEGLSREGDDHG